MNDAEPTIDMVIAERKRELVEIIEAQKLLEQVFQTRMLMSHELRDEAKGLLTMDGFLHFKKTSIEAMLVKLNNEMAKAKEELKKDNDDV